jgi:hypothetical protein
MTFADKCKLLSKRRSRHAVPAASDRRLRAACCPALSIAASHDWGLGLIVSQITQPC